MYSLGSIYTGTATLGEEYGGLVPLLASTALPPAFPVTKSYHTTYIISYMTAKVGAGVVPRSIAGPGAASTCVASHVIVFDACAVRRLVRWSNAAWLERHLPVLEYACTLLPAAHLALFYFTSAYHAAADRMNTIRYVRLLRLLPSRNA